ncbi:helix-turn-helix domain-containing protein [Nesterenkonia aerolata]|uniref:Helix-turn-helix domain-containing protein n=1 Tax=Nesterenkonia aerolata TaxID=3074079 RepID=A0ABU2DSC9_9MICC|nr:helix-turn-helix domain-containing protein [Nesterenkonia sp. LY-0111]MDR8019414.1 helix-turn-helix domain-containing protein [Nesterenkonia sp. LY-0111]
MSDNPFLENQEDEWLSTYDVAQLLGYKRSSSVRDAFYNGMLDGIRFQKVAGRWVFHKGDLLEWKASRSGSTAADRVRVLNKECASKPRVRRRGDSK